MLYALHRVNVMNRNAQNFIIFIALCLLPPIAEAKQEHLIQGRTMGTTYQIQLVTGYFQDISGLKAKIDQRLEEVNRSMSTYQKDSEISRFNNFRQAGKKFRVSGDFYQVMRAAQTIYRLSGGAWDGTIYPLVNLWGFGSSDRKNTVPQPQEIAALMPNIGFGNIEIKESGFLLKKNPSVTLDLSSIAKGYGVDQVAAIVRKKGFENYLVEIGGEVLVSGYRKDGKLWRIGINRPKTDAAFDDVYSVVDLHNKAFATSGDYRNFFMADGVRYSHVIDPATGYPVTNGVVSVTIIADTCTFADGLATAIMVMGVEKGLDLINRLENVEGLIIAEKQDGSLIPFYSKNFN
jgi:thiamine biosynthesis lipoprotein